MSRSKREAMFTEGYGGKARKSAKKHANKRVRHSKKIGDGKAFKKISNSWDICDYKFKDSTGKAGRK